MLDLYQFLTDNIQHNLDVATGSDAADACAFTQRARGVWYAGFRAFRDGLWKPDDAQWAGFQELDRIITKREHALLHVRFG